MTSGIKIASNALVLLGHEPIASFDEATAGSTIANELYESSYLSVLTEHRWRFSVKTQELSKLAAKTLDRFEYKFQLPPDLLYLIKIDTQTPYEVFGKELHTNVPDVTVDYVTRVDESQLPPYFVKMLEYFLASQFAVPLTGDLNKADFYSKQYGLQLRKAKFADSSQRPTDAMSGSNRYTRVRY